jgi:Ser/Thr protein kinase RdoA (MazF antagonist)
MKYGKIIGTGNTASVYELDDGKVLKLFYKGYSKESIEKEFFNAMAINNMDFAKPKVYEIVNCEDRMGIIYDRMEGECLLDWVIRTGDIQSCAVYMAQLHRTILSNKIYNVQNYKDFLKYNIVKASSLSSKTQKEALEILDELQEGNTLCHGDFHPGNIFIYKGETIVIDFMNLCHGDFLYDIARTVFLVEYTPVPLEAANREMLLQFKKALADLYLIQMKVTRDMIQDYLAVIIAARAGECPKEQLSTR